MQIDTSRFGRIEIADAAIIQFPRGLYGFSETHAFCLLDHDPAGCFRWLQAIDTPPLAMVITDPFPYFNSYEVEIPDDAAALLQAASTADVAIYTSVTFAADRESVFANLLGPLVINHRAGIGMQLIQDATRYSTRHLIVERRASQPDASRAAAGESGMALTSRAC